jgi:hypothetical protein
MPVAEGYPGSRAWKDAEETRALAAILKSLMGRPPVWSSTEDQRWAATLREFTPETRGIIGRVADLLGPAGKEALREMVEGIRDDTREQAYDYDRDDI